VISVRADIFLLTYTRIDVIFLLRKKMIYCGVELTVSCHKDIIRKVKFVSVEISNKSKYSDGYK